MAMNTFDAGFEDNVIDLMKEYGIENIDAYKDQCLSFAQKQGLSGLSDLLQEAQKTGTFAFDEPDSLSDLMGVSGGTSIFAMAVSEDVFQSKNAFVNFMSPINKVNKSVIGFGLLAGDPEEQACPKALIRTSEHLS